jgi:glyoxylase-like metal-dependent hydrolase (beta-lactamase superfamily II)
VIVEWLPVGPLQCNCVIVGDEASRQAVVVDPGDEVDKIGAVLARHRLKPVALVATHAHIDHVGGLSSLKQTSGARTLMHEADVPLYQALAEQAHWLGVPTPGVTTVDELLREGSTVPFGMHALEVLHTPGHSPGSVSLVLPAPEPMLLAGDTLFAGSIGRTDLWGGSFDDIMRSIRAKLLPFADTTVVVPGHGPKTTIGEEKLTNPFLQLR